MSANDPRSIHDLEQQHALAVEHAAVLRRHYNELVRAGFDEREALELTKELLRWLLD